MNKKIITVLFLFGFAMDLKADTPSFDFVEYGTTHVNVKGTSKNLSGRDMSGSITIFDDFFFVVDEFLVNPGTELKLEKRSVGFGYHYNFSDTATFYTEIDRAFIDPKGHGNHELGMEYTAGIRSVFYQNLELETAFEYLDVDGYQLETLILGAVYKFTKVIGLYSDVRIESDTTRFTIGARLSF